MNNSTENKKDIYFNPSPEYEKPFKPIDELIFSKHNKWNNYLDYNKKELYFYK